MEKILNDYLEKIERYLKPLPISERVDIVKEIQSEIFELQSNGKSTPLLVGIGFLQAVLITVLQVFPDW